ncbi:ROK family protein [Enterobacter mori]|uniref:ROK family protein n=1 Tax=Enterobacter mori TaxID=539813 RepID=UPI001BFC3FB4|nr:ROK family protein [Enterobacter mori]QWC69470.1 ROK family protein [Enterobacter mori]HDW3276243.1 ROK family protein [Enterobacter asburiae]
MHYLGLDIGGTKMEAVLLSAQGDYLWRKRQPTQKESYAEFMLHLVSLIDDARAASPEPFTVGIGLPGAIDPQTGLIKNCNCLVLNGHDLKADLASRIQQPVWIANDADCFTLSEAVDGAGTKADTVFGVIIGTGCGGGIAVRRHLLQGPNAIAGEWGHNPLPGYAPAIDGPAQPCYCGKHNCIESFISGTGFARRFPGNLTSQEIISSAEQGEPKAREHWRHFIDAFARSLASVINILDPQVIVLGGGLSNVSRIYDDLPVAILPYLFSETCHTRIVPARFGDASGVRGAAWLPRLSANEA